MSIYRVSRDAERRLLGLPESGLGYQAVLLDGELYFIFNATIAVSAPRLFDSRLTEQEYRLFSEDPESEEIRRLPALENLERAELAFREFMPREGPSRFPFESNKNVIEPGDATFVPGQAYSFYRYSAFSRDKRVSANGDFLPGTYCTTFNDMHFVPSGFAAVGRYALPNPASARFAFQIVTVDRPTLMGTATPNYGQAGGGVEVYFDRGAANCPGTGFLINIG